MKQCKSCSLGEGFQFTCLYADDLVVIAETEVDLIKMLNEWKDNVENKSMRVNMNKTKVMISEEWLVVCVCGILINFVTDEV